MRVKPVSLVISPTQTQMHGDKATRCIGPSRSTTPGNCIVVRSGEWVGGWLEGLRPGRTSPQSGGHQPIHRVVALEANQQHLQRLVQQRIVEEAALSGVGQWLRPDYQRLNFAHLPTCYLVLRRPTPTNTLLATRPSSRWHLAPWRLGRCQAET